MIDKLTRQVADGAELTPTEIASACEALLDEQVSIESRADFLTALHTKGETSAEIAGFVETLLVRAVTFPHSGSACVDVCGTGGDKAGLFNVSTASMFVATACGARVIKHGNRGITSKSGGADALEALGVRIDLPPEAAASVLDTAGCCFLFAPAYHPAFRAVAPVRKWLAEQGCTTVFNMIGPLLNPARPDFQLAGVFDPALLPTYAEVFHKLGRKRAWAVHGSGPHGERFDEVSPVGPTRVLALEEGHLRDFTVEADDNDPIDPADLLGGDAAHNAALILAVLEGKGTLGAQRIVELNASAALVVCGIASDLSAARALAKEAIVSGAARAVLEKMRSAA